MSTSHGSRSDYFRSIETARFVIGEEFQKLSSEMLPDEFAAIKNKLDRLSLRIHRMENRLLFDVELYIQPQGESKIHHTCLNMPYNMSSEEVSRQLGLVDLPHVLGKIKHDKGLEFFMDRPGLKEYGSLRQSLTVPDAAGIYAVAALSLFSGLDKRISSQGELIIQNIGANSLAEPESLSFMKRDLYDHLVTIKNDQGRIVPIYKGPRHLI